MNSVYAKWANLATGFIAFLTICFSPITMNKFNRRPLILLSCFTTGFFLIVLIVVIRFIVSGFKQNNKLKIYLRIICFDHLKGSSLVDAVHVHFCNHWLSNWFSIRSWTTVFIYWSW